MKKSNWWNEPMTRKNWGVVYAICIGITVLYCGGVYIWLKWQQIQNFLSMVRRTLRDKFGRDSEFDED